MSNNLLIVVALGGNAISKAHQRGTVAEQFENSRSTAVQLADLVLAGHQLVITHGNGPQIGNFLLRNEAAAGTIYPLPMEVAAAHVQGGMGFMIAQTLMNELARRGDDRVVTTTVTTVVVDSDDPSFAHPTKPIGRQMTKESADDIERREGWTMKEVSVGTFRRVVASPPPRRIVEIESIRRSVRAGDIIVACGGGGIPVARDEKSGYTGVQAVIDKDLSSAMLARDLGADCLLILTTVDRVRINFSTADEKAIDHMTMHEARRWLDDGQFPPGSMGPKVFGAINFLDAAPGGDVFVVIGPLDRASDALAGTTGTRIDKH